MADPECDIIIEDGKEVIVSPDGEKHALGLVPDDNPPMLPPLSMKVGDLPSREKLIDLVESNAYQNGVGGASHYDPSWTKNQNGWGKCASSAATYLIEKARDRGGQPRIELSDDYLYSLVNGGRDRGSTLSENLRAITRRGIATRRTVGEGKIYRGRYNTAAADKEALRFRAHEGYATRTEQEVVTALVGGVCVGIAIHVGRNWKRFDRNGVLIGDRGPGNHAEHLDHVRYNREKGRFEFRQHSSHGKSQGDGGFFWVTWANHLATVHSSHVFYAVPNVIFDPYSEDEERQPDPVSEVKLVVASGEFCHWCKKWNEDERPQVEAAGVNIRAGDVPGSGVPRFRLEVGSKSEDKIGYWGADEILRLVADMRMT